MKRPASLSQEPSAAQNGTVIETCKQCGVPFGADSKTCYFCQPLIPAAVNTYRVGNGGLVRVPSSVSTASDWRGEVSQRLQEYRKRRQLLRDGASQPELSFGEPHLATAHINTPRNAPAQVVEAIAAPLFPRRVHPVRHVEIDLIQPALDFSAPSPRTGVKTNVGLVSSCASLRERRVAAALDVALILFSYGLFLSLFAVLGGRFLLSKLDISVLLATLLLFYTQYFALFTLFGGSTPGMNWRRLRVAAFEGGTPSAEALAWRSFGYFLSAATLMLGFFWSLWDEDHLCWHDRISQTHLTWEPEHASARGRLGNFAPTEIE